MVATRNPFMESSRTQCLFNVAACLLTLAQVYQFCPKRGRSRLALWILMLIPVIPYIANEIAIELSESSASSSFDDHLEHPAEELTKIGKAGFQTLVQQQSKTYKAAHAEYQRRYAAEPPPGFEAWYKFAVEYRSPIIDDFDIIFDAVSPFWKLSGKEVNAIMDRLKNLPNNSLWNCRVSGEHAKTHCTNPYRTNDRNIIASLNDMLGKLHGSLPDLEFIVNHLDEPRVLIPPVFFHADKKHFNVTDMSRSPSWKSITKFCENQPTNESTRSKHEVESFGIPFISNMSSAMDLCRHPEYSSMYSLFMSPTSFSLVEGLAPVLSTGAPSTMGDILFPSPAYQEHRFRYDESHDIEWEKKKNNLYWAGSTTGGFAVDDKWQLNQRQRFVTLVENSKKQRYNYLRARGGIIHRVTSSFLNRRLFDVAFTNILQCARKFCRDQRRSFSIKPWADGDRALRSKLVFDIDGNGISGRYYKLLASRSTPLKQTLLREWHDDRLVPWVHYLPISQGMEEVPELVLYLTTTKSGQRLAKEIANQGREWFSKAFRDIDLTIYMYRLLLELARLQDPKREALR